jgi:transposase
MKTLDGEKVLSMLPYLDERQRRMYLATEAVSLGYGGIKALSDLTGVSENTIAAGIKELENKTTPGDGRVRRVGGGRKPITETQSGIEDEIKKLVDDATFGNPENPLSYTTKSLRKLEETLAENGFTVSHRVIGDVLKKLGYSLQKNKKCLQLGEPSPDRDAQFRYINDKAKMFIEAGQPVISVDTKKKELIGNFMNGGAEYRPKRLPTKVLDHDFMIKELGKVAPYGVYDVNGNVGFVNLGTGKDTAEFAVHSITLWWDTLGKYAYPSADRIYINCDSGGSNGYRVRLWKKQLQEFANATGLSVHVSHFPSGTSKWNKIEHRMFCYISKNWRGRPLVTVEATVELIASTTTKRGLKIHCVRDDNVYNLGETVTDSEFDSLNIVRDTFHGEWNYSVLPQEPKII